MRPAFGQERAEIRELVGCRAALKLRDPERARRSGGIPLTRGNQKAFSTPLAPPGRAGGDTWRVIAILWRTKQDRWFEPELNDPPSPAKRIWHSQTHPGADGLIFPLGWLDPRG